MLKALALSMGPPYPLHSLVKVTHSPSGSDVMVNPSRSKPLSIDDEGRIIGWLGTGTEVISTVLSG